MPCEPIEVARNQWGAILHDPIAFHVPAGAPGTIEAGGTPSVEGGAAFPTAWFSTRERANEWLTVTR